ncbi:DUF427 domain-containing protein [Streptomyces sp. NBC_00829]|uniref:DUF427 domain-containing protein n=1 Tax=Streptomyces sp. NBC_00829 TaxID=2903679 RepID=UPI00386BDDA3|nr:DUF427 domain-containing protein [Streptomyces sp. NBC_00829]
MPDYPEMVVPVNHVAPVPRRIRAVLAGETVLDTTRARYVWEWSHYPQYYIPLDDIRPGLLTSEDRTQHSSRGTVEVHGVGLGDIRRPHAAKVLRDSPVDGLSGTVRFDWAALDAWFEEDEQVFVHPRHPYARVDALRSNRQVRVELEGVVLAESASPVMVFETGLPTRYYLDRNLIDFRHLIATDTVTACPYKGTTSGYWSARVGEQLYPDLAWTYDFPTRQLMPVAGLVAFYNERVDMFLEGQLLERPVTHFSSQGPNSRPCEHL